MTTELTRSVYLSLEAFSRATGLHPELVTRLVRLGLLDVTRGARGDMCFDKSEVARAARIQRLHTGLSLNYASLGLVLDLLDRIDVLEAALRRHPTARQGAARRWT
jgi:hypothetical protein